MDTVALSQPIKLGDATQASYWRPAGVSFLDSEDVTHVYLSGYDDDKAFNKGADPVTLMLVDLPKEYTDAIRATGQFPTKSSLLEFVLGNPVFRGAQRVYGSSDPIMPPEKRGGFGTKTG